MDNRQGVTFDLKSHQYGVATTIYMRERCLANPPCGGPVAHFSPKVRMHLDELLELIKVQGHAHGRVFERKRNIEHFDPAVSGSRGTRLE